MEAPYVYSPLEGPRDIRLLQVFYDPDFKRAYGEALSQASSEAKDQTALEAENRGFATLQDRKLQYLVENFTVELRIRARFVVASLDMLPFHYKAVSYVWGDARNPFKVWIDDSHYLEVTNSAMKVLNYIVCAESDAYFWIDALCINQEDIEERGHQVRLMYDVYSRAQEVIGWTGCASADGLLAMEFVCTLRREIGILEKAGKPLTRNNITNADGCQWPSPNWTALTRFLHRSFFHRIWIVQELVAAKRTRLVCDLHSLDFLELADVVVTINATGLRLFIDFNDESLGVANYAGEDVGTIVSLRYLVQVENVLPPLPYVLAHCQKFQSTDPRDRVFAFLNISLEGGDDTLAPNYSKPVETVFADSARHMLKQNMPLMSLLYAAGIGYRRSLNALPSWVPDWSIENPAMSFGITADTAAILDDAAYQTCGKDFAISTAVFFRDDNTVIMKGRIIDTIKSCFDKRPALVIQDADGSYENALRISEWLLLLCDVFPTNFIYPTGVPFLPNVLSHILTAGDAQEKQLATELVHPHFLDFFAMSFLSSLAIHRRKTAPTFLIPKINIILSELSAVEHPVSWNSKVLSQSDILRQAYESCEEYDRNVRRQRKIFTTPKGYAGLGPLLMREGDVVCLIYGTRVPYLIRKVEGPAAEGAYYHLVGECYVHGLMHGEGMSIGVEEDITLR